MEKSLIVNLREITYEDLSIMLAWAWIPEIWKYMPTSREGERLLWEEHLKWFRSRKNRIDWLVILNNLDGPISSKRPVGEIHVCDDESGIPEIGMYLGEVGIWGKGVGGLALGLAIDQLVILNYGKVRAQIHPENVISKALFMKKGFRLLPMEVGRNGQQVYELDLRPPLRRKIPEYGPRERTKLSLQPVFA